MCTFFAQILTNPDMSIVKLKLPKKNYYVSCVWNYTIYIYREKKPNNLGMQRLELLGQNFHKWSSKFKNGLKTHPILKGTGFPCKWRHQVTKFATKTNVAKFVKNAASGATWWPNL